jgi:hypothetical protein
MTEILRRVSLALCLLLIAGCFEVPVRQRLQLVFEDDGTLRTVLKVELVGDRSASPAMEERLAREEDALLRGDDPWRSRFEALEGDVEELSWRKEGGLLRRFVRTAEASHDALLEDGGPLGRFWGDTPIFPVYAWDEETGVAELALYPGTADRATRREACRVDELLAEWSEHLLAYFRSLEELYVYLESRPDRALATFGELFDHDLELPEVTAEEGRLTEAVTDQMLAALGIFELDEGEAETLEEISRRVFDPFPAEVSVKLPSPPLEAEGFEEAGGELIVPGLSLWAALRQLEDRWVWPNPLAAAAGPDGPTGEQEVDVVAVAAAPRRWEVPLGADEIEQELRAWLSPARVYRVTWALEPSGQSTSGTSSSSSKGASLSRLAATQSRKRASPRATSKARISGTS